MMPRWLWHTILVVASFDLALNLYAHEHDRPSWHLDVALISIVTIVAALVQLGRRPQVKS